MNILNSSDVCCMAGCGSDWVGLVPVLDPGESDLAIISDPAYYPACEDHRDLLWERYGSAVGLALIMENQRGGIGENSRESFRAIAGILNTHDHPTSKSVGALLDAATHVSSSGR